jgi:hypothetical protein
MNLLIHTSVILEAAVFGAEDARWVLLQDAVIVRGHDDSRAVIGTNGVKQLHNFIAGVGV